MKNYDTRFKPWIANERRTPVSDEVKKKYLGRNCFSLDQNGNVKYNVKYIQLHYYDYDTVKVFDGVPNSKEHIEYMSLIASIKIISMYRYAS